GGENGPADSAAAAVGPLFLHPRDRVAARRRSAAVPRRVARLRTAAGGRRPTSRPQRAVRPRRAAGLLRPGWAADAAGSVPLFAASSPADMGPAAAEPAG